MNLEEIIKYTIKYFGYKASADFDPIWEVYRAFQSNNGTHTKSYYYTSLNNAWKNSLRRNTIREGGLLKQRVVSIPDDMDFGKEDIRIFNIEDYNKVLDNREKTILDLALQGYDQNEVAGMIGMSIRTVKGAYSSIREKIRPLLYIS